MFKFCKLLLCVALGAFASTQAYARAVFYGYAEQGGNRVSTSLFVSTTKVQKSFPGATVSVFIAGTGTLATIYDATTGIATGNPLTADGFGFYEAQIDEGCYDITFSGTGVGITTPWTVPKQCFGTIYALPLTLGTGASLVDGSTWATTKNLRLNYFNTANQGNVFVLDAQLLIGSGIGGVNSESSAIITRCKTANASGANTYDCVGIDGRGIAQAGNMTARLWGGYFESNFAAGSDGAGTAVELVQNNFATADQATVNTVTSKGIASIICAGTQNCTTGLYFIGTGGATIHKGLYVDVVSALASGANDAFIQMASSAASGADVFSVKRDGYVTAQRLTTSGVGTTGTTTSRPTFSGAGFGAGATFTPSGGSSDLAGEVVITAGAGAGALGTLTITYSTTIGAYGTNGSMCTATLRNGSAAWGILSTIISGACTTTSCPLTLYNNANAAGVVTPTVFTNGATYAVEYICAAR
jgi:hypothetical protein